MFLVPGVKQIVRHIVGMCPLCFSVVASEALPLSTWVSCDSPGCLTVTWWVNWASTVKLYFTHCHLAIQFSVVECSYLSSQVKDICGLVLGILFFFTEKSQMLATIWSTFSSHSQRTLHNHFKAPELCLCPSLWCCFLWLLSQNMHLLLYFHD